MKKVSNVCCGKFAYVFFGNLDKMEISSVLLVYSNMLQKCTCSIYMIKFKHTVSLHSGSYLKTKVVPEEISTNCSPQFISTRIQSLLKDQCVNHGLSSAYYPKSSGRAGFGVTTLKII